MSHPYILNLTKVFSPLSIIGVHKINSHGEEIRTIPKTAELAKLGKFKELSTQWPILVTSEWPGFKFILKMERDDSDATISDGETLIRTD